MSDLFHKSVPFDFVDKVFDTMEQADHHVFQVLTKRSSRLRKYVNDRYGVGEAPMNIWLGVSVEDSTKRSRIRHLRETHAGIRFLSIEPLIGSAGNLELEDIHWVIVGGESGPGARPMAEHWVTDIRDQCVDADVPFFFKQWGGFRPKSGGRHLEGVTWDQFPEMREAELRILP